MITLSLIPGWNSAQASTGLLQLGPHFSTFDDGGSIDPSFWNGASLAFVYCLDIYDYVDVPGSYNATTATSNGVVTATRTQGGVKTEAVGLNDVGSNASGQIAWLLDNYGVGGQNTAQVLGLQEAIWKAIYGASFCFECNSLSANAISDMNTYYNASIGRTGNVSNYLWLSPAIKNNSTVNQALVAKVPEQLTTAYALGMFLAVAMTAKFLKRKRA